MRSRLFKEPHNHQFFQIFWGLFTVAFPESTRTVHQHHQTRNTKPRESIWVNRWLCPLTSFRAILLRPSSPRFAREFQGEAIEASALLGARTRPEHLTLQALREEAPPMARGITWLGEERGRRCRACVDSTDLCGVFQGRDKGFEG